MAKNLEMASLTKYAIIAAFAVVTAFTSVAYWYVPLRLRMTADVASMISLYVTERSGDVLGNMYAPDFVGWLSSHPNVSAKELVIGINALPMDRQNGSLVGLIVSFVDERGDDDGVIKEAVKNWLRTTSGVSPMCDDLRKAIETGGVPPGVLQ